MHSQGNIFFKAIIVSLLFALISRSRGGDVPEIIPPLEKSKIGYLTAYKNSVRLKPAKRQYVIQSGTKLPVYAVKPNSYVFLIKQPGGAVLCEVKRLTRNLLNMNTSLDGHSIYFRGVVTAHALPFQIKHGEELPVTSRVGKGYLALLKRKDEIITVYVPHSYPGIKFSRASAFDEFAKDQRRKGLMYYRGKWLPVKQAEKIKKAEALAMKHRNRKWFDLQSSARQGFIELKNGRILVGALRGIGEEKILFEYNGREIWIKLDQVSDSPLRNVVAKGLLTKGDMEMELAGKLIGKNKLGEAALHLEKAIEVFKNITENPPAVHRKALEKSQELRRLIEEVDRILLRDGIVIYQYKTFPRDELRYHMANNHILFRGTIWLKKSQICRKCKGSGETTCHRCHGKGTIFEKCTKCTNGYVPCPICKGSGQRKCPTCNGYGEHAVKCTHCKGTGKVKVKVYKYTDPGNNGKTYHKVSGQKYYRKSTRSDKYEIVEQDCQYCDGTGKTWEKCRKCGGKGTLDCVKSVKCFYCKGKGGIVRICPVCSGRKIIACPDCKGKGFHGSPQEYQGK